MNRKLYPKNWKEISEKVKEKAGYKCELCGHKHEVKGWHILTTAHIIPLTMLCEEWNLIAACQRCHIGRVEKISQKLKFLVAMFNEPDFMITNAELKAYATVEKKYLLKKTPWR